MNCLRFALAFHNHQPVGNFDGTIEQTYQQSYLPFLEVFSRPEYASLKLSLHHSGCLEEWLEKNHPEYLHRLAELVAAGRLEILGGPFQEPILAMLPSRDRIGQVRYHSQWLEKKLGATVQGMWMPERVWEQNYVEDLAQAGIRYTIVDDYHFKRAGLVEEQLFGYYMTEDDGRMMAVFPGSEKLRYWIPFHEPSETIAYFRHVMEIQPNAVMVFGDDGEKFGSWPGTFEHVYQNGWLVRFLDALVENADWLRVVTCREALAEVPPLGKCYLPDCSYREMTEWSLPASRHIEYDRIQKEIPKNDSLWQRAGVFLSGGTWRNFKVKYPETNEMYSRMMAVSETCDKMQNIVDYSEKSYSENPGLLAQMRDTLERIRLELYRGQCNCAYWHGAFGGVYLPHLRNAIYQHLIHADNLLRELGEVMTGSHHTAVSVTKKDYNFDGFEEIRMANRELIAWLAPRQGGILYELDLRGWKHNLLATLARRPELDHERVRQGAKQDDDCASIHERIHFKQTGLEQLLEYDSYPRKSLVDLFFPDDHRFAHLPYTATIEEGSGRVTLVANGPARALHGQDYPITVTKTFSPFPDEHSCGYEVHYRLENLPSNIAFRFGVEMNFAGMPGGCDDRFFYDAQGEKLGNLSTRLELPDASVLGLVDEWLNLNVRLVTALPATMHASPVETVSGSEDGFEAIHQSVSVRPTWEIQVPPESNGLWENTLRLEFTKFHS